jgi:hypothetical protein
MSFKEYISKNQIAVILLILLLGLPIIGVLAATVFFDNQVGPEQPIPFSHRVHVKVKKISCFICHDGAMKGARAGIPPLETCMLCHSKIIIHHPEIEILRHHYQENMPVIWRKIYKIPDFVFFNHSIHIFRQIDCGNCHGNVLEMDRIEEYKKITMGFCLNCHRKLNASVDCFTCHR